MTVTANSIVVPQTPRNAVANFTTADTAGTYKTLCIAGANGSKVMGAVAVVNGATAHVVSLRINSGGTLALAPLVSATVGANAGAAAGTTDVSLFSTSVTSGLPIDQNGNPFIALAAGDTLQATYATAMGTADALSVMALAVADF